MTFWLPFGADGAPLQSDAWPSGLVMLHAVSDGIIALSFLTIPIALLFIYRKRGGSSPGETALVTLFAMFIFAVGLAHLASLVAVLVPGLPGTRLEGLLKAFG